MEINVKWIISSVVEAESLEEAFLKITDSGINDDLRECVWAMVGEGTTITTEVEGAQMPEPKKWQRHPFKP